jgi:putative ABC transport system substrate-binding protein
MRGLRQLGHVPGSDVVVDVRWAEGRSERFAPLLEELVARHPAVIVVSSTRGALAATAVTKSVPVVFVGASDPVALGLVASLSHPGGNVTGLSWAGEDGTIGKIVEHLKVLLPNAQRIGFLFNPAGANDGRVRGGEQAVRQLGLAPAVVPLRRVEDLSGAFDALVSARVDALVVVTDPLTLAHRESIVRVAAQRRLPAGYEFAEFARAGGLLAYAPKVPVLFERAALYVDKILRGEAPAELPVEQPTAYELVINLGAARMLGLDVPASLQLAADELIR